MIRILILILCQLCGLALLAQSLNIYLNTNDCVNCTSALSAIRSLDSRIQVDILCDQDKKRFIPDVLSNSGIAPGGNVIVDYIPAARILKAAPGGSECNFCLEGKELFRFPLRNVYAYLNRMNMLASDFTARQEIPLPASLHLSDQTVFTPYADKVIAIDHVTSRAYTLDPNGADTLRFAEITIPDRFKRDAFIRQGYDTVRYDRFAAHLKAQNEFSSIVNSANVQGDTLHLMTYAWYPDPLPEDTSRLLLQYCCTMFTLVNNRIIAAYDVPVRFPKELGGYLKSYSDGFFADRTSITMPLLKVTEDEKPTSLLVKCAIKGTKALVSDLLPVYCPKEVTELGNVQHIYYLPRFKNHLYMMHCYPFFHDLSSNDDFDLSDLVRSKRKEPFFKNHRSLYWTWDASSLSKDLLLCLYAFHDKDYLVWFDLAHHNVLRRVPVNTNDCLQETMTLTDDGRIIALAKSYDHFIIIQ